MENIILPIISGLIWRACEKTLGAQTTTKIYSQFEKEKRKHEHQSPMLEFKKEMS